MINVARREGGLDIRLPADLVAVDKAAQEVTGFLDGLGFGENLFEVNVLVREALLNAVTHGSKLDMGKQVDLALELAGSELTISVRDPGPGWDWKTRPITLPPPDKPSGRGLFLIQNYADDFTFNEKGNRLTLRKRLSRKG